MLPVAETRKSAVSSRRPTPAQAREARKIRVVRDPFTTMFNRQRRVPRLRHQIADHSGLLEQIREYLPVPITGRDDDRIGCCTQSDDVGLRLRRRWGGLNTRG